MNTDQQHSLCLFGLFLLIFMVTTHLSAAQKGFQRVSSEEQAGFLSEEKVALIIGLSEYPSHGGLTQLKYADDDANAMGKALEALGYKVRVLINHQATGGAVMNVLDDLGHYLTPDQGTFLFYFSGHGFAHDKVNYLATYESHPKTINATGLSLNSVVERMQASGAKRQVLLVDACRNNPDGGRKSVARESRGFVDFGLAEGTQILFSTKFGSSSYEYSALRHGVYTHFLLKGLNGEARKNDGMLSFTDLANYVSVSVKDFGFKSNRTQLPFVAGESYGDFLLHAVKVEPKPEAQQQAALDLSFPDISTVPPTQSTPTVSPVTAKKKRPWYKNPWLWAGVVAGGAGAVYMSQDSGPTGDRDVIGE